MDLPDPDRLQLNDDRASPADAQIDAEPDAQVDADPRTMIAPGSSFSIGPDDIARQDEDSSIVVDTQGSLYALWYSNRGSAAAGHLDKVYAIRSIDGATWTPPVALSSGNDWAFAPSWRSRQTAPKMRNASCG